MVGDYFDRGDNTRLLIERVLTESREQFVEWMNEFRAKTEAWASEHGYSPLQEKEALSLIDKLRAHNVASFEGLGIKVTFFGS